MDIQVYSTDVRIEAEHDTSLVTLSGVDISNLLAQVSVKDLMLALEANDSMSEVVDYVTEYVNG